MFGKVVIACVVSLMLIPAAWSFSVDAENIPVPYSDVQDVEAETNEYGSCENSELSEGPESCGATAQVSSTATINMIINGSTNRVGCQSTCLDTFMTAGWQGTCKNSCSSAF